MRRFEKPAKKQSFSNCDTEMERPSLFATCFLIPRKTTGRVLAQQNGIETIGEETLFGGSTHTSYPLSDGVSCSYEARWIALIS